MVQMRRVPQILGPGALFEGPGRHCLSRTPFFLSDQLSPLLEPLLQSLSGGSSPHLEGHRRKGVGLWCLSYS